MRARMSGALRAAARHARFAAPLASQELASCASDLAADARDLSTRIAVCAKTVTRNDEPSKRDARRAVASLRDMRSWIHNTRLAMLTDDAMTGIERLGQDVRVLGRLDARLLEDDCVRRLDAATKELSGRLAHVKAMRDALVSCPVLERERLTALTSEIEDTIDGKTTRRLACAIRLRSAVRPLARLAATLEREANAIATEGAPATGQGDLLDAATSLEAMAKLNEDSSFDELVLATRDQSQPKDEVIEVGCASLSRARVINGAKRRHRVSAILEDDDGRSLPVTEDLFDDVIEATKHSDEAVADLMTHLHERPDATWLDETCDKVDPTEVTAVAAFRTMTCAEFATLLEPGVEPTGLVACDRVRVTNDESATLLSATVARRGRHVPRTPADTKAVITVTTTRPANDVWCQRSYLIDGPTANELAWALNDEASPANDTARRLRHVLDGLEPASPNAWDTAIVLEPDDERAYAWPER